MGIHSRSWSAVVLPLVSAVVLSASVARAADADGLDLPQGVRFKPAPAAVNDAARKLP